jgi:hypothetical protein
MRQISAGCFEKCQNQRSNLTPLVDEPRPAELSGRLLAPLLVALGSIAGG